MSTLGFLLILLGMLCFASLGFLFIVLNIEVFNTKTEYLPEGYISIGEEGIVNLSTRYWFDLKGAFSSGDLSMEQYVSLCNSNYGDAFVVYLGGFDASSVGKMDEKGYVFAFAEKDLKRRFVFEVLSPPMYCIPLKHLIRISEESPAGIVELMQRVCF